jgi:cation diffusion facilitator family transporter
VTRRADGPGQAWSTATPAPLSAPAVVDARDARDRRLAKQAVSFSAAGLALTGLAELAVALLTGSVGLLGDAIHNLSDVSTSGVVFFGFWVSKKAPTERYPYGYERAEDLAGLGVAVVIWLSAGLAAFESYRKLVSGAGTNSLGLGIVAALVGIGGNLAVSHYKQRIGTRIHSSALIADAHHSRLDALSSVGALAGLVIVAAGYPIGDPIAGFAVTVLIIGVGFEVTRDVLHHLLDGIEPELLVSLRSLAATAPGVTAVLGARGRWTGRSIRLEVTIEPTPGIDLREIETTLLARIQKEHEAVRELIVRA